MGVAVRSRSGPQHLPAAWAGGDDLPRVRHGSLFAIALDIDTTAAQANDPATSWPNAYRDVDGVLQGFGFTCRQDGVYFGDDTVDAVRCVLAMQALSRAYPWFAPAVRDIRMLRIEDNNDLMPAVTAMAP